MRVIAGQYKGRTIACLKDSTIRPTTDRVKEAMFGALQFEIEGMRVLDAFAGSGALGIEALSRGAAHVNFIEKNPECLRVLENNLKAIVKEGDYRIVKGDALKMMPSLGQHDLMLLDPPYDEGYYEKTLELAQACGILAAKAKVVMECRRKFDFSCPKEYTLIKRRDYGDISLYFLEYGAKVD